MENLEPKAQEQIELLEEQRRDIDEAEILFNEAEFNKVCTRCREKILNNINEVINNLK